MIEAFMILTIMCFAIAGLFYGMAIILICMVLYEINKDIKALKKAVHND